MKTSETLYCAMDVVACIIRCSNRIGYGINYLHLQKLLYFVQAYSFILYGKPIFVDDIYATTYGVKVPDVEQYYRRFGGQIIGDKNIKADIYRKVRDKDLDMIKKGHTSFSGQNKHRTDENYLQTQTVERCRRQSIETHHKGKFQRLLLPSRKRV